VHGTAGSVGTIGADLQHRIAGPGARSYAFVIDWHIRLLLALTWFLVCHLLLVGALAPLDTDTVDFARYVYLAVVPAAGIYLLYHPVLEIVMRGTTPGKRMAGVRILTLDGLEPGLRAHLIRNLLRVLDSLPVCYLVGLVATAVTANSVRIGDLAAGTVLVYDPNAGGDRFDPPPVDPAAVSRLGRDTAQLCHDLLHRWDTLDATKRHRMAVKLLGKLDPGFRDAEQGEDLRGRLQRVLDGGDQT